MKSIIAFLAITSTVLLFGIIVGNPLNIQNSDESTFHKVVSQLFKTEGIENNPPKIKLISPLPNSLVDSSVGLFWIGNDKDRDALIYYVYVGENEKELKLIKTTHKSSIIVNLEEGKEYFWRVDAFDGKSFARSNIWKFETLEKKWTALIYLNGDNDLSLYAEKELNELLNTTSEINITILFDGPYENDSCLYSIINGNSQILTPSFLEKEVNMGDAKVLKNCINFIRSREKTNNIILEIWGHGNGWLGTCFDKTNSDMLTLEEIKNAVGKVSILIFSSCYMGNVEVAYALRNTADYMIACEASLPAGCLPHKDIFDAINSNMNPGEICFTIIEKFSDYVGFLSSSFAVWNLSKMEYLSQKVNEFSIEMKEENYNEILEFRNLSSLSLQYIDLFEFAKLTYNFLNYEEAKNVMNAINETILLNYGEKQGVGIYFPLPVYQSKYYPDTDFCISNEWDEFIAKL